VQFIVARAFIPARSFIPGRLFSFPGILASIFSFLETVTGIPEEI